MLCAEGHGISELLYGSYVIKRKRLFVQKEKKKQLKQKTRLLSHCIRRKKKFGSKHVWRFFAPTYYMAIEEVIHV